MTITQLQYILAVAEYKNFTLAAQKCFITQPTLSMQIQKIEEELDIVLFDRSKKPIQLTEVGHKIVNQAKTIINETERIKDIVDYEKKNLSGEFRLGIIPTITPTLLPMFLKNFTVKYPNIKLIIEELHTDEIISRLKNGHLNAAITATPLKEDKIKEFILYYEPFVAYIPENFLQYQKKELNPDDININDVLLLQDGHCFRENILNLCQNKTKTNQKAFQVQSGSFETLIKLANEGLGITFLPYLHTLDLTGINKERLRNFAEPKPAREISLIYPTSELKIRIIEALKTSIIGVVKGAILYQNIQIVSPLLAKTTNK